MEVSRMGTSTVLPPGLPHLLTLEEVARVFRTSTRSVRKWINAGRFPQPVKVGRRLLWTTSTIAALAGQRPTREGPSNGAR
jgi:predicted DNA-binding transcriptional regulator AlpA